LFGGNGGKWRVKERASQAAVSDIINADKSGTHELRKRMQYQDSVLFFYLKIKSVFNILEDQY
jgi:hypothetical protein